MTDVKTHAQLVGAGFSRDEVRRMVRAGSLVPVRRGAYVAPGGEPGRTAEHRRLVRATVGQADPGSVVSHVSAAVVRHLPVPYADLSRVDLTRDRAGGGRERRWVRVHGVALADEERTTFDALPVTTLPRTFVDVARATGLRTGVALGDAVLRSGVDRAELQAAVDRAAGRHGIGAARRALAFLDARAESAGESVSRVLLADLGLPPVQPQLIVKDVRGAFVARVDLGWPELGVVGEFDGRVTYGRALAGDDPAAVVWDEKVREDAIRTLGWQVVRWTWDDFGDLAELCRRLEQAFERASRTTRTGSWATT